MRWITKEARLQKYYGSIREWRLWFAWTPIRIGSTWVWLENVERRGEKKSWFKKSVTWSYRFIEGDR